MAVLNDLDRFHLVQDSLERRPAEGTDSYLIQEMKDKLIEHKLYINANGQTCRRSGTGSGVNKIRSGDPHIK